MNIFFTIQDFWATLCFPEKQGSPGIFHYIEYTFYIQEFWATCMYLPWKTEGALNSQYWLYIFYIQDFWANCACPEKQSCPEMFRCMEYTFTYRIFEQFACACPEKQSCPDIFHCIWTCIFIIQDLWATSACPDKQSCTDIFCCIDYTFTFWVFEQLALALKTEGALNLLYWM